MVHSGFPARNMFFKYIFNQSKKSSPFLVVYRHSSEVHTANTIKCTDQVRWFEPGGYETNLSIYNPLTKLKTKIWLQNDNFVKWYSCGPTVYDSAHIGHASCYVKLDIIRRILVNVFGIDVFYLMGVTDIDDKIIKRSNENNENFSSLASKYEKEFFKDLQNLNILPPSMTVKVSDHIPEIIAFINTLVEKGQAYKVPSGSVYFAVKNFERYGKLYPPQLSDSSEKPNPEKHSPMDFTLWKASKDGEPSWQSPWGPGRPGWHIECSAMASKVLGPRLDIHSGGQDLVFPHHENEEAQSCAFHDTHQWVNYWIHSGHLLIKGDVKMSKSLKNTISISELLSSYTSNQFRMLCLLSPYRNSIEYSSETMGTATGNLRRIESFIDECKLYLSGVRKTGEVDEPLVLKLIQEAKTAVRVHLSDDFDTSKAMEVILQFVSTINSMISKPVVESKPQSIVAVAAASSFVSETLTLLGLTFAPGQGEACDSGRLSAVVDAALELRYSVREAALHADMAANPQRSLLLRACDSTRNALSDAGVQVKDHKSQKSTWSLNDVVSPKLDK